MQVKFGSDMKIFAQIGDPLEHSCTSYIHNSMYALGNVNAVNFNVVVKRGELPQFAEAAKVMHLSGFGITMPQKTDIIPLLDECDEFSRIFNSVNHVKIENGRLIGKGMDGLGMRMAIEQAGVELKKTRVLILGAGSVTGPIAAELCKKGASAVTMLNRTVDKAKFIADVLAENFPALKTAYGPMTEEEMERTAPEADLVVQCTSLGIPVIQFFEKKCIGCGECVRVCPHSSNGHTARNHKACELCGKCASVCYAEALILTGQKLRQKN